jgi:hypothetical protein
MEPNLTILYIHVTNILNRELKDILLLQLFTKIRLDQASEIKLEQNWWMGGTSSGVLGKAT